MEHYKSWAGLNKWLNDCLCDPLQGRITYFLTRYHKVHDAYGRAAILLDGKELVCFSWIEMYKQEADMDALWQEAEPLSESERYAMLKPQWDGAGTYYDMDFLNAVLAFRKLSIQDALRSENHIIQILAILDRRVGKRTLEGITRAGEYQKYPAWVRQFYELRIQVQEGRKGESGNGV